MSDWVAGLGFWLGGPDTTQDLRRIHSDIHRQTVMTSELRCPDRPKWARSSFYNLCCLTPFRGCCLTRLTVPSAFSPNHPSMPEHNKAQEIHGSITPRGKSLLYLPISPTGLPGNTEAQRECGRSRTRFRFCWCLAVFRFPFPLPSYLRVRWSYLTRDDKVHSLPVITGF
ncbi:hypothetical protein BO78DRAFT_237379 [Aspergillus sclerotiicarbonarius CBS 121057]|uniref:Uncharacterized protein n=1 Tax=Aspergillus sclerotiicarbonarius (strain CBS 121057 / IBT 28362) TaxID=1448318 RepID=A0A319FM50_ASPSB|nr:hypothetical protein BO78DRAFT_237379 [Aspergillus sclerotiicarbonarius CBS 121057]